MNRKTPINPMETAKKQFHIICNKLSRIASLSNFMVSKSNRNATLVLVEIKDGLVQDVGLLSPLHRPLKIVVWDHDQYQESPAEYNEAVWRLS